MTSKRAAPRQPRRTVAHPAVLVAVTALAAVAGDCSPRPSGGVAERTAAGASRSLLEALDRGELVVRGGPSAAASRGTMLVREGFDGVAAPMGFASRVGLTATARGDPGDPLRGAVVTTDPSDGASVVGVSHAARGLLRDVALGAKEAARVRARVRRAGEGEGGVAGLFLETLDRFVGARPEEAARNRKLRLALLQRRGARFDLPLAPGVGWQELELIVLPQRHRAGLRVMVVADEGGLFVDELEVEALDPRQAALDASCDRGSVGASPWRRRVRLGDELYDSLVLKAGERASLELVVPPTRPRLDLAVGGLVRAGAPPPTLIVRADGRELARLSPPPPGGEADGGFAPATVSLERLAGRRVQVELEAVGEEGDVLLAGDPRLLSTPDTRGPPSLLLISIDTLRADRVGCYGGSPSLTPNLDRLAREGTRCARVVAASTWTLPSHAALFTGQFPEVHGVVGLKHRLDERRSPTLAVELAAAGYATAAFTGGGVMDPAFGFGAGFSSYSTRDPGRGAPTDAAGDPLAPALDWLSGHRDQPFFLFVHTYRVHNYKPGRAWVERVAPGRADELLSIESNALVGRIRHGDAEAAARMRVLYDANVAQADAEVVGRLLDRLAALKLEPTTLVCVLSDHGEEFLEHGGALHGDAIWRELDHVPWILRGPGVPAGRVIEEPVSHVDVLPTLLARLGITAPPTAQGVDVLTSELSGRPLFVQLESRRTGRWDALVAPPWKLVRRRGNARVAAAEELRLFCVEDDPDERHDLADADASRRTELARRLDFELAAQRDFAGALDSTGTSDATPDAALLEELRKLGYGGDE